MVFPEHKFTDKDILKRDVDYALAMAEKTGLKGYAVTGTPRFCAEQRRRPPFGFRHRCRTRFLTS